MRLSKKGWYKIITVYLALLVIVIVCGECGIFDAENLPTEMEMVMPSYKVTDTVPYMTTNLVQNIDTSERNTNNPGDETTTIGEEESSEKTLSEEITTENISTEEVTTLQETSTNEIESKEATTPQETTTKKKEEKTTPVQTTKKEEVTTKKSEEQTTMMDIDVNDYESVNNVVLGIVTSIVRTDMSDFDKVLAIHDWITFNIDYDFTYTNFYVPETLRDGLGVCQGYALLFEMMADFAGLECIFVGGEATNSSGQTGGHAWNQVKVEGTWYCIDTVWDDPASYNKDKNDHSSNRYDYFLVSTETFHKNHTPLTEWKECPEDYDKITVLKAAVDSGVHKNVRLAYDVESGVDAIEKAVKNGQKEFTLWYYDTAVTKDNMRDVINKVIKASNHSVSIKKMYYPKGGVTRYILKVN